MVKGLALEIAAGSEVLLETGVEIGALVFLHPGSDGLLGVSRVVLVSPHQGFPSPGSCWQGFPW